MSNELKPCPFCKCTTIRNTRSVDRVMLWCVNCGAEISALQGKRSYEAVLNALVFLWNTRPIEDALRKEIAQLQTDNRSLVEQVNKMALKPNQAVIEYFYPKYNPITKRLENLPTKECLCIVELYSGKYEIVWWISAGFEETGWDGYCVDEVKSWAYLPKGVTMEMGGKDE